MTKSNKLSIFIFSLLLVVASLLFVACGEKDYSNVYITSSQDTVELFVGEEQNVTLTINNPISDMSNAFIYNPPQNGVYTVELFNTSSYSTTYTIRAIKGGEEEFTVRTSEGNISYSINIIVREYSESLTAKESSLYVSLSRMYEPSSADFNFSDNSTERDLDFYFYGVTSENIDEEDLMQNEQFINKFSRVNLVEQDGNQYLVFEEEDALYTLSQPSSHNQGTRYSLVEIEEIDGLYNFEQVGGQNVSAGDEFTFLAVYTLSDGSILTCQRNFYVLSDINYDSISHDFGYKIVEYDYTPGSDYLYKMSGSENGDITLVPSYRSAIESGFFVGNTADFVTAYLEVTMETQSDLLNVKASNSDNSNIINTQKLGQLSQDGYTTYYYQINCATSSYASTNFNLTFYYEGFENSEDSNVNFTYSVPVQVRVIPTNLLLNDIDLEDTEQVFTFYNYYAPGNSIGWQRFNLSLNPEDAEYDSVVINLTGTGLRIRYNGTYYSDEDNNPILTLTSLDEPIYIKGVDNAPISYETQELPITLNFNVLQQGSIQTSMKYQILQGVTYIRYIDEELADRVYIDLNQGEIEFLQLYADAHFEEITITRDSCSSVVRFVLGNEPYRLEGGRYILNISIVPLSIGSGSYTVSLDNGEQIPLYITVDESLTSVSITSQNQQNSIRYSENLTEDDRNSTLFYVYNRDGQNTFFDVQVVANGNQDSSAINSIQFNTSSAIITIGDSTNNNKNFNVYVGQNGSSTLTLAVDGILIENFKPQNTTLYYYLDIVGFNYIEALNVYKESDGRGEYIDETSAVETLNSYGINAAYADVFSGTNIIDARSVKFNVTINNDSAYLFADPALLNQPVRDAYVQSTFEDRFVYWETDWSSGITLNGQQVSIMYYDSENLNSNVYTLQGIGTFDTSTMTFTALANLENPRNFKLIAHVRQYGYVYSYTINVRISVYEEVDNITLQDALTSLEFTSTERELSLIAYPTNSTATNGEIVALFDGGQIPTGNGNETVSMITEDGIRYIESDGRYQIILTVNDEFVRYAETYTQEMEGRLRIVARDWLDDNNNLYSEYSSRVIEIPVYFANGTEQNRFTLETAEDVANMNLSAHYKVSTTIDISSISGSLPLGELTGSIVGTGEYASITGISILNGESSGGNNYYGLFTSIAEGAYIEYISFSGEFNVGTRNNLQSFAPANSYIGLIAGINNGSLINIGVTIDTSVVNMVSGQFGGVVGLNNGLILQDYTLFEDNNSDTRSYTLEQLESDNSIGNGRYSYANLTPKILVYYTGDVYVYYNSSYRGGGNSASTYIGGAIGYNRGSVRKVDSKILTFTGYSNYMAYSLLEVSPYVLTSENPANVSYVGGLIGSSSNGSIIESGYNIYQDSLLTFTKYLQYAGSNDNDHTNDYTGGQGIVVGGEVSGYNYVGGVVGYIAEIGESGILMDNFTGITSRCFVRGRLASANSNMANVAGIANISSAETLRTAFAMQAVDEGGAGINASMIILYYTSVVNDYFVDASNNIANTNKLAFGISSYNNADVMYGIEGESQVNKNYTNVTTYVISREKLIKDESSMPISSYNRTSYYGDFIVVGSNESGDLLLGQSFFIEGDEEFLSLDPKFNNQLIAENPLNYSGVGNKEVYYMYYFGASLANSDSSQNYQDLLDEYLNYVNYNSIIYPFITNGEMIFSSNTRDILTIDQNGRINVKATGLAQISASSVLNTNNALEFYIYVVDYFNPDEDSFTSNSEDTSIIYPSGSINSTPISDTTINLRGENSASLYVRPHYSLEIDLPTADGTNLSFVSDATGLARLSNVVFYLNTNTLVSAEVTSITRLDGEETISATSELDIDVTGQTLTIRKNENTIETDYKLKITPKLSLSFVEVETTNNNLVNIVYSSNVNKELDNVTINYKKGALSINNSKYIEVPLISSKQIVDTIIINSTAVEEEPYYYITNADGENVQGSEWLKQLNYSFIYDTNDEYGRDFLFNVSFERNATADLSNQTFNLTVTINKNSPAYLNRYEEDIYGQYVLYILAQSNTSVYTSITINFEQTDIMSVVVDNYTNLSEVTGSAGVSSTSEYAYPGTTGLLAITVTPDDSDFDYILIENAESNYQTGNASATFGFLARKANADGNGEIFEQKTILGSSTSRGLRLELNDIIDAYNEVEDGANLYYQYSGIIYVKYDMSSLNVVNGSTSSIVISLVKDGERFTSTKELTVQLQNYVTVEIDGKTPTSTNVDNYFAQYSVARGMRYRLNINSYGYMESNISAPTVSDESLATIVEEDGVYYLEITSNTINYNNSQNSFDISISASQTEGEVVRTSSSLTKVTVQEYVFNYSTDTAGENADIVANMGDGRINVQVGTQTTFEIDMFDYIEYDSSNVEVVNSINSFMDELERSGTWIAHTNLISDSQPDYGQADDEGLTYTLGYTNGQANAGSNYFFTYNGLNVLPVRTHVPSDRFYYFTFNAYVAYSSTSGTYQVVANENLGSRVTTEFVFNVYSSSSEESPLPIYDYEDFLDMQSGGYYILLNDITLPNVSNVEQGIEAYTPISATFKSFDGNGHTINFAGAYDMGSQSSIGLFTSLPSGSIIRNLNVNFTSATDGSDVNVDANDDYGLYGLRTVKFITTADNFNFGAIVVDNQGIITNCNVTTDVVSGSEYYIAVQADNALAGTSYIGGISAINSGYITNCEVSANIKAPYNLGGIVGQNNGKIASSSYEEGKLINNSQQNQHVAGFAVTNSSNGQIITSFVSGEKSSTSPYSQDQDSYISSTLPASGFVYQNAGTISDCYTDIYLENTYSDMAGFAYYNGGTIKNAFSLSVLRNNVTASSGFARYNTLDGATGEFINCYYFYNQNVTGSANDEYGYQDGFIIGAGDINTSVVPINYNGIERLNAGDFANVTEYFTDFSYQDEIGVNGVWFLSRGNTSTTFVDYVPTTEKIVIGEGDGEDSENQDVQTNTVYREELMNFGYYRLELASANIDALSIRNFSYSEVDDTTGSTTYHYVDDTSAPNRGSIHNPRVIYDASTMESEITEQTSSTGLNIANYRLVSDINYSDFDGISSIYLTTFAGVLEGNGMEVSQINLVSMDNLESAGLFAQIGYSSSRTGTVKNLTISPRQVAFTNSRSVGTLAGTLRYGYIYDITVDGKNNNSSDNIVVIGQNFTGGVVGRAVNAYSMKNIVSDISVSATYTSSENYVYNESITSLYNYSYAGSIAGYLGTGEAYNIEVENVTSVLGSRAGLAFGGIGSGSDVSMVFVDVMQNGTIRGYHYAGYVVGETVGSLSYAYVSDNQNIESSFSVVPRAARAVGGITGVLAGGNISNAVMEQSFRAVAISNSSQVINYVGGIAGMVANAGNRTSTITNSIVEANITGSSVVGGAIGQIENALIVNGVAVKSAQLEVTGERTEPAIGGIVGNLSSENNASLTMTNSYSTPRLVIATTTSGVASTALAGGLVGGALRTPYLAYCYTTSTVEATVEDLRSLDETADYSQVYTNSNIIYSYEITTNYTNNAKYDNVYYLGHNTKTVAGSPNSYLMSTNYDFSFSAKAYRTQIGLRVNNYGTSSLSYSQQFSVGQDSDEEVIGGINENTFYNLFGATYLLPYQKVEGESGDAEDIIYNHINNSYNFDSTTVLNYNQEDGTYVGTSSLTNYVEEIRVQVQDDGQMYLLDEDGSLTSEVVSPLTNNSTRQVVYISESGTNQAYIYYSNIIGGVRGFLAENSISLSSDGNVTFNTGALEENLEPGTYTIRTTTHTSRIATEYQLGSDSYEYASRGGIYLYVKDGAIDLDLLGFGENTNEVNVVRTLSSTEGLLLETSYTSGDGNYYEHTYIDFNGSFLEAYVNVVSGTIYAFNDTRNEFNIVITTGEDYEFGTASLNVPSIAIWNTTTTGLSTLYFENDLGWLR